MGLTTLSLDTVRMFAKNAADAGFQKIPNNSEFIRWGSDTPKACFGLDVAAAVTSFRARLWLTGAAGQPCYHGCYEAVRQVGLSLDCF